jgi:hypothetical protein
MFFLNETSSPYTVYVLPDQPPILALTYGSLFPIRSDETPSFNLISLIVIYLQRAFLTVKDKIISPKF